MLTSVSKRRKDTTMREDRPTLSEIHSEGIGGFIVESDAAARLDLFGALVPQDTPPF